MPRISKFQQRTPTYTCGICSHVTRETGDGESGAELCSHCYALAGLDNQVNDNGSSVQQEGIGTEVLYHAAALEKQGKSMEWLESTFTFLFPKAKG